jgi:hypothetical protein
MLAGGAPVNAADLQAIAVDELERLRRELRTAPGMPWKAFWNIDSRENPTEPRVENQCRNTLLTRLKDRLDRYRIAAIEPEARRANETRADMLVLSGAGKNLPVEIKRHDHKDIWVAAGTQLAGYAADEGADGRGIYLVFWFGTDWRSTPALPGGGAKPIDANEIKSALSEGLAPELRDRIKLLVIDVSKPRT